MKKRNALIIFMKTPRLGTVKTRLQPDLTPQQSLKLYMAMAEDLTAHFRAAGEYDLYIYFWPPDGERELRKWLGGDLRYAPQRGEDLGEKMHCAFSDSFEKGYLKTVIIGSDLPSLDDERIREAFRQLDEHDAVFGPASDGGYYLVALKMAHAVLFQNISWSTERVLQQTLENARSSGIRAALLSQETDIDTNAEVEQLWAQMKNDNNYNSLRKSLPKTFKTLSKIFAAGFNF